MGLATLVNTLGYRRALTIPGVKSRETDMACRSKTLLSEVIARKNMVLKPIRNLSDTQSSSTNPAQRKPFKYYCQIPCHHPSATHRPQPASSTKEATD